MSAITNYYNKMVEGAKFSYFGLICMTITIVSVVGAFAAMLILKNDAPIWMLGLNIGVSMANNVAAIGQAPAKWVVNLFIISMIVNIGLILMNL